MIIKEVHPITCHFVVTDDRPWCDYTRYGPDNWMQRMGEGYEPVFESAELEAAFQAFIAAKPETPATPDPVPGSESKDQFREGVEWLGAWLVDHCEGEMVSEELVMQWATDALRALICPECRSPVQQDRNSFWCHRCRRLWPKGAGHEVPNPKASP